MHNNIEKGIGDEDVWKVFGEEVLTQTTKNNSRGEKKLQAQILAEMISIDHERALTTMKAWADFVQQSAARPRSKPFASLEEYLPYRIIDAGEM